MDLVPLPSNLSKATSLHPLSGQMQVEPLRPVAATRCGRAGATDEQASDRRPARRLIRSSMVGPAAGIDVACCYLLTNPTNHTDPSLVLVDELVRSLVILRQGEVHIYVSKWSPPEIRWLKLNKDAATDARW
jgi:hypothetical protein